MGAKATGLIPEPSHPITGVEIMPQGYHRLLPVIIKRDEEAQVPKRQLAFRTFWVKKDRFAFAGVPGGSNGRGGQ